MIFQDIIKLAPYGKGAANITELISNIIKDSNITIGTCQLFTHNSSSSLLINDTVDETTKGKTNELLAQLAPCNDDINNMINDSMDTIPDAMLTTLMQTSVSFPVSRGRPALGTWQGIYLWERTTHPQERKLTITIIGE